MKDKKILHHGGDLAAASSRFGEPAAGWLDMSTGISPWSWPVTVLPESVWRDLPYPEQGLRSAAASFYGCPEEHVHIGAGSQAFIQAIPKILQPSSVAVPAVGYQEHALAWQEAGHQLHYYQSFDAVLLGLQNKQFQHVVLINPNNPSAECYSQQQLLALYQALPKQGVLIVDEAFADADSLNSLSAFSAYPRLFVLRSVGKFFGLAGLRLGFCLASDTRVKKITQQWRPWPVSHPALWVGEQALLDTDWQRQQIQRLQTASAELIQQLQQSLPQFTAQQWSRTSLFVSLCGNPEQLYPIYQRWAEQGVLLRYIETTQYSPQAYLRFGLPGESASRLNHLLTEIK